MSLLLDGAFCAPSHARTSELSEAEFEARAESLIERIRGASTIEDAATIYRELLPFEAERVRREAARRLRAGDPRLDLLFVTVGAQADSPTLATIASPAHFVVFLHSDEQILSATTTIATLELSAAEATLRSIGDGKDALVLYQAVRNEWEARGRPAHVGVDITGGLKIMSAAAAAAAFCVPGASVYYIDSTQIRLRNAVFNCRETRVALQNPFEVFGEIRRAVARELFCDGRYDAAAAAYRDLALTVRDSKADEVRAFLAEAYDDLTTLNFARAAERLRGLVALLCRLAPQMPDDQIVCEREQLRAQASAAQDLAGLAILLEGKKDGDPSRDVDVLRTPACRELIALLLAATDRRIEDCEYDIAALFAYRASELIVQRRLAILGGADTANLDWDDLARTCGKTPADLVCAFNVLVDPGNRLDAHDPPRYVARSGAFALLTAAFPEDLSGILPVPRYAGLGAARNKSLLAHGLHQIGERATRDLRDVARKMFDRMLSRECVSDAERESLDRRHRFLSPAR